MFNKATFALLLTAGLLANAFAAEDPDPVPRSSERPIETSTVGLPLPNVATGSMTLRPCETCAPVTLELTSASRFFLGRKPVSYADLRAYVRNATANAVVFYDIKTNVVTRIVASDTAE